jgi:hypothetical protein
MWRSGRYTKIWLFSDEPNEATSAIPSSLLDSTRIIPDFDKSSSLTLELMRHGKGYVIANSTFSWWGAFMSYSTEPEVCAPTPWFVGQEEPINLIPTTWHRKSW